MNKETQFNYKVTIKLVTNDILCIRPAQKSDLTVLMQNIQSVCDEQIYLMTNKFIVTEEWHKILENSIDEHNRRLLVVAEINNTVIGHLRIYPEWYGIKGRHVGQIGMSITNKFREIGIGNELLNYTINWAKFIGLKKLTASVFATNKRAINLFKKFNFVLEGERKKQFLINDEYIDEILVAYFFN